LTIFCYQLIKTMNLHIRSNWTANSQYYIDFDRGSVIHSKTSSRGQSNRFFNDH